MGSGCSSLSNGVVAGIARLPSLPQLRRHSPLALWERAVPLQFLELLVDLVPFPKVSKRKLGDLFTREVVSEFVKPLTAKCKLCYIEALREGHVRLPWTTVDEKTGNVAFAVGGAPAVAKSTFFVSHAWSYRFKDLVQLVKQHAAVEGDSTGTAYWLDILAVTQNFTGKFENHIDGDFGSVIRESKGLMLTIHPFVQPKAPTRVWCLYEVVNAVQQGKPLDLVMDPMFGKTRAYDTKISLADVGMNFEVGVIAPLDVNNSDATVQADKVRILDLVRVQPGGIKQFNELLKKAMRSAVKDALLMEAVYSGDVSSAEIFINAGGKIRCSSVAPPAGLMANSAKVLCAALLSGSEIKGIHLIGGTSPGGALSANTSKVLALLMDAIDTCGVVTDLSLARLGMTDTDASMIARAVAKISCPLKYLDLSGNNFGDEGITALSHGFADNHSRTGSLTKILIDMPKGGRNRDNMRATVMASSPHVTWVGGTVRGGTGAAAAVATQENNPLALAQGVSIQTGGKSVTAAPVVVVNQTPRVGAVVVPPPLAKSSSSLSAASKLPPLRSSPKPPPVPAARARSASTTAGGGGSSTGIMGGMLSGMSKLGASISSTVSSSSSPKGRAKSGGAKRTAPRK